MDFSRLNEMLWDCRHCGTQRLLAKRQNFCAICGTQQETQTRYFSSERLSESSGYKFEGKEKICSSCRSYMGERANHCTRCGGHLYNIQSEESETKHVLRAKKTSHISILSDPSHQLRSKEDPSKKGHPKAAYLIALMILMMTISIIVLDLNWTRPIRVQVTGHHWQRKIDIDRFVKTETIGVCSLMPPGAQAIYQQPAFRGLDKLPDSEDCEILQIEGQRRSRYECLPKLLDAAPFEVFCNYQMTGWQPFRSVTSEGDGLDVKWPETGMISTQACLGCEKESSRTAIYELLLKDNESKEYRCETAIDIWRSTEDGETWQLRANQIDNRPNCESLQRYYD